jgi:hypothetical protein
MKIVWRTAGSKKKAVGRVDTGKPLYIYFRAVKDSAGGWTGKRIITPHHQISEKYLGRSDRNTAYFGEESVTDTVGPFKEKADCIAALETIQGLKGLKP